MIVALLSNRTQAVKIGSTISDWRVANGGIPQGTKLGVLLFTIMTNNLLRSWNLRIKFVDDTTVLEIILRNSISVLGLVLLLLEPILFRACPVINYLVQSLARTLVGTVMLSTLQRRQTKDFVH